jgi:hypothetical protein
MVEMSKTLPGWRADVRQAFLNRPYGASVLLPYPKGTAVVVKVVFVMPRTVAMRERPAGDFPMVQKPDVDKLGRGVLDALKSAGVYADDSQVVGLYAFKRRGEPGEPTGAMIHVERDPSRCVPACRMLKAGQGGHPGPCMMLPDEVGREQVTLDCDQREVTGDRMCPAHGVHPHRGLKCLDCSLCVSFGGPGFKIH